MSKILGFNLTGDTSNEANTFLNAIKHGQLWGGTIGGLPYNEDNLFPFDNSGYPTTMVSLGGRGTFSKYEIAFFQNLGAIVVGGSATAPFFRSGTYVFMFDGAGTFSFSGSGITSLGWTNPNRMGFSVPSPDQGGIRLTMTNTDPLNNGNYARNFRFVYCPTNVGGAEGVVDPNENLVNASQMLVTNAGNNGSGKVQLTVTSTAYWSEGDKLVIAGILGTTEANGYHAIHIVDGTRIDLPSVNFSNVYVSGGYAGDLTKAFNADTISKLSPFQSQRFMGWTASNNTLIQNWSDRPTVDWIFWGDSNKFNPGAGGIAPYEVIAAFCNKLNCRLWINPPNLANNDYFYQAALLFYTNLNSNINVFVEFGNENWNLALNTGGVYADAFRAAAIIAFPSAPDSNSAGVSYGVLRSIQCGAVWKSVFGAQQSRITRMFCGQAGNSDININYGFDMTYAGGKPGNTFGGLVTAVQIVSDGSITTVNWTAHGLVFGMPCAFTGTVPTGMSTNTTYYVKSFAADSFTISATPGGVDLATTAGTYNSVNEIYFGGNASANVDAYAEGTYFGYINPIFAVPAAWAADLPSALTKTFTELTTGGILPTQAQVIASGRTSACTMGTASGARTDGSLYVIGSTNIALDTVGTGTILAGDVLWFGGDPNFYTVFTGTGNVSGGNIVLTSGLLVEIPAATKATVNLVGINFTLNSGGSLNPPQNGDMTSCHWTIPTGNNPTLSVDGGTAYPIVYGSNTALYYGILPNSNGLSYAVFVFNSSVNAWQVINVGYPGGTYQYTHNPIVNDYSTIRAHTNASGNIMPFYFYEGGQHFIVGDGTDYATQNIYLACNRDSRMYNVYLNWLNDMSTIVGGADNLVLHHHTDPGHWLGGQQFQICENVMDVPSIANTPKYQALLDFLNPPTTTAGGTTRIGNQYGIYKTKRTKIPHV